MTLKFVDVHCFAGGLALGVQQSGFELVGKKELPGGFGAKNMEVNRDIIGNNWELQAAPYEEWEPIKDVELIIGNPPCSGFSVLSSKSFRGVDSKANACMWGITEFAAKTAPPIFAFESVQGAYTVGATLMRDLRARLEELTGMQYDLTHVLHSARSMGSPQIRRRYMFVAHRVPFGVEVPMPKELPTVEQAIGDLTDLNLQWESQAYVNSPLSDWAKSKRAQQVDGHVTLDNTHTRRMKELFATGLWEQGMGLSQILRAMYDKGIPWPAIWENRKDYHIERDFNMGINAPHRIRANHTMPVITGGGLDAVMHYSEDRTLTHREIARLMGFPDNWKIAPNKDYSALKSAWGKGVTVDVGRYFGEWLFKSLNGNPGSVTGELIGERERLVNITNSWKTSPAGILLYPPKKVTK